MGGKPRATPRPLTITEAEVRKTLDESRENVAAMGVRIRKVFRPTEDRLLLN